jgi:aminoglycoside 6'-N-acetyltransferase
MIPHLPFDLPRLRFRVFAAGDLPAFHAYRSQADVARFQGWAPMTLAEARRFLAEQAEVDCFMPGAWVQIAIADKATDNLTGDAGLWLSREGSEAEFGLTLKPEVQGRGFGTEAIRGIIDYLMLATPAAVVTAATDVRNTPCVGALRSAGMKHVATREQEYKGELCTEQVFRCLRAGWENRNPEGD